MAHRVVIGTRQERRVGAGLRITRGGGEASIPLDKRARKKRKLHAGSKTTLLALPAMNIAEKQGSE